MTIVFNLLCKAFIAILDILLLDFYLKNIYSNIYLEKLKKFKHFIYPFFCILLLFINDFLSYILIHFVILCMIILIYCFYRINKFDFIKKILSFYIFKIISQVITIFILSWLFNIKVFNIYIDKSIPNYSILLQILSNYNIYTIFTIKYSKKTLFNIRQFKLLSIITLFCFIFTFIFKTPILFRIVSIARTYIFTVLISIIALICFDRMQTKYEKDKHLQESIIQNLEKEKEFNQQREQQQKEIRKINHNLNNILIILQSHLEKEEYEEAKDYIEQNLKTHVEAYQALTHTGIAAIDGALNAHIQSIKEKGIQYDEDISKILHLGSIVPGDLALIISLALDNAKEACENIDGEKHISLKLQSKQTHVILYIENSIPEGSHPTFHKTSKKDKIAHGFGVSSIKEMAERYHGEAKYEVEHDQVILRVVLQK